MTVQANSSVKKDNSFALFSNEGFNDDLLVHTCSYLPSETLGNFVRTCTSLQNNPEILRSFPYAYCSYTPKNEDVYKHLLKNLFPLFKLPTNANSNAYTAQTDYERLRAAHARSPMAICTNTLESSQPQILHQTSNGIFLTSSMPNNRAGNIPMGPDLLKYSQDGKIILGLSNTVEHGVNVFDQESQQIVKTLVGHGRKPAYIQISPDNEIAHTAENSDENGSAIIKRWNLKTGECIGTFAVPNAKVGCIGCESNKISWISPDGKTAIAQCVNKNFTFFEVETSKILLVLNEHYNSDDTLTPIQISHDQTIAMTTLAMTVLRHGFYTIHVWNLKKRQHLYSFQPPALPTAMALTPDGTRALIGCANGDIVLLHVGTNSQKIIKKAHGAQIKSLQIAADGTKFFSTAEDRTKKDWDLDILPEEFLRRLELLCEHHQTEQGHAEMSKGFCNLPQFAQKDITAIEKQRTGDKVTANHIRIYTALQLQSTRRLLQRALREPQLAKILVSEAFRRTNKLTDWVQHTVYYHLGQILRAQGNYLQQESTQYTLDPARVTDVQAYIRAITQTIAHFQKEAHPSREEGKRD